MSINWKLRFKNKTTLVAMLSCVIAFVYQILGIFGVVPAISEASVTQFVGLIINFLVAFGVVVDPTTKGVGDSALAQSYTKPN